MAACLKRYVVRLILLWFARHVHLSLTQIITNAIVTKLEAYHDVITNENNNFCNFAKSISIMNSIRITFNIYQERARILSNVSILQM